MTGTGISPHAARNARPFLHGPEIDAVADVLREGHYGHTEITEEFEHGVAGFLGVADAVAVASGTAALHIALHLVGIGPGDEVIVPSMTYCATVQAILAVGARPRFVEVSPQTLCVTGEDIRDALAPATRAVVPVLYGGRAVDLGDTGAVLADRGVAVIEDAAHAFGSFCGTTPVGATGALTCFSFGPIKNLTCGQGGMIIPRDEREATAARALRGLGVAGSAGQRAMSTTYAVVQSGIDR